jgi:Na+/phosphate symporter
MTSENENKGKGSRKRVVVTNVRVTKETHEELQVLSDIWDTTMSDAISSLIHKHAPEVLEEIRRRKEIKRKAKQKREESQ